MLIEIKNDFHYGNDVRKPIFRILRPLRIEYAYPTSYILFYRITQLQICSNMLHFIQS